jgi:hypothetical protein
MLAFKGFRCRHSRALDVGKMKFKGFRCWHSRALDVGIQGLAFKGFKCFVDTAFVVFPKLGVIA